MHCTLFIKQTKHLIVAQNEAYMHEPRFHVPVKSFTWSLRTPALLQQALGTGKEQNAMYPRALDPESQSLVLVGYVVIKKMAWKW